MKRILLDLDGVLNRFPLYCLTWVGCNIRDDDYASFPNVGYDSVKAANTLKGYEAFTRQSFWRSITRDCWATVPKSAECDWLIGRCASLVGKENVCILTAPTIDPDSAAGKVEWIQRFMPRWLHRQFLIGPAKEFCAHNESLLIDDYDGNVSKFREAGGHAITVPRPWNSKAEFNTRDYLERQLSIARGHCVTT